MADSSTSTINVGLGRRFKKSTDTGDDMRLSVKLLSFILNEKLNHCERLDITTMNAEKYPLINVMNVVRGFNRDGLKYRINPVRFQKKSGEVVKISKVRHFHHERKGKGQHFHYVVEDKEDGYYHICLDTNSYTWRLIEEKISGVEKSSKIDE